jgi:hypothetical protein
MQIGIFGILGIVFIVLKLVDVIAWSWWLVLLPIYGPLALGTVLMLVGLYFIHKDKL